MLFNWRGYGCVIIQAGCVAVIIMRLPQRIVVSIAGEYILRQSGDGSGGRGNAIRSEESDTWLFGNDPGIACKLSQKSLSQIEHEIRELEIGEVNLLALNRVFVMQMQKKIPGYFVQKNVQDQLEAAGYVFGAVRDITSFARTRRDDIEMQEFFQDVVQRLLSVGDSLKDSASAVGEKTRTSVVPVTLIKDNINSQLQFSQQIFRIVQDIAKFAKSRHRDEELLAVLEASARDLIGAGDVLASSASETGDQLLHSIAMD